jgi:hypothetical protein
MGQCRNRWRSITRRQQTEKRLHTLASSVSPGYGGTKKKPRGQASAQENA